MVGTFGGILLAMAFGFSVYFLAASIIGTGKNRERWLQSAGNASIAVAILCGVSLLVLALAFLSNHFEINYVAQHSSKALPVYLKISAVWAGQEGSLLLWCFLQALFTAIAIHKTSETTKPLIPWVGVLLSAVTLFFLAVNLFYSNPFLMASLAPADGLGLNPVLRHPGMILHPPILYIGYVALSIPFAFALSAVLNRKIEGWTSAMRGWILLGWLGLGVGLLLGMRWSYDVLGWGGYWGWDPVENTGLIPWLAATALLHGSVMQDEKQGYWVWNYWWAVLAFAFVILGTFTTRSGLVQSVHAYSQSNLGMVLLAAFFAVIIGSLVLSIIFRSAFPKRTASPALLSRSGSFFFTLLLFSTLIASILFGSLWPTISTTLLRRSISLDPTWFDKVTGPQFTALLLLIGICPLLGKAVRSAARLKRRWWIGLVGAVVFAAVAILLGLSSVVALAGLAIAGFAISLTIAELVQNPVKQNPEIEGNIKFTILPRLIHQQRKYGGLLVHIGVIFLGMGIIGTRAFAFEQKIIIGKNQTATSGGYTFLFDGFTQENFSDHANISASLQVSQNGRYLVTLQPLVQSYSGDGQSLTTPAIYSTARHDLYVITAGWTAGGETASFAVFINPLINFIWAGGLVLFAGGALALWPKKAKRLHHILFALLLVISLSAAVWLMWGASHGRVNTSPAMRAYDTTSFKLPADLGSYPGRKI